MLVPQSVEKVCHEASFFDRLKRLEQYSNRLFDGLFAYFLDIHVLWQNEAQHDGKDEHSLQFCGISRWRAK